MSLETLNGGQFTLSTQLMMPTQLTWSAMIRSLSFDRQSAERLKTESSIFCLAQLDIGTPNETRFSSNLFKLLNASKKPFFFLARISWVKWFVLDIFVLFPFISIQLSLLCQNFVISLAFKVKRARCWVSYEIVSMNLDQQWMVQWLEMGHGRR